MPVAARTLLLLVLTHLVVGCTDSGTRDPGIRSLDPNPASPGDRVVARGEGLGESGRVFLGGREAAVVSWRAEAVTFRIPDDALVGFGWVTLRPSRGPAVSGPIEIELGAERRAAPPRAFGDRAPVAGGGGGGERDGGAAAPDAAPADAAIPDRPLRVTFTPDPSTDDGVALVALEEGERLKLAIRVPRRSNGVEVWGAALHLAWDRNLLAVVGGLEGVEGDDWVGGGIGPGRAAAGWLVEGAGQPVLTFRPTGAGEGRIEMPARHRTLRHAGNAPIRDVRWLGGSVRVVEVE